MVILLILIVNRKVVCPSKSKHITICTRITRLDNVTLFSLFFIHVFDSSNTIYKIDKSDYDQSVPEKNYAIERALEPTEEKRSVNKKNGGYYFIDLLKRSSVVIGVTAEKKPRYRQVYS